MWWCCGKTRKDAPGCKFSKHQSKDDEEDEKNAETDKTKFKNTKCYCCKENGHTAQNCNRDPNIKTNHDILQEMVRIDKFRDYKKLNADTFFYTSKLFEHMARKEID